METMRKRKCNQKSRNKIRKQNKTKLKTPNERLPKTSETKIHKETGENKIPQKEQQNRNTR